MTKKLVYVLAGIMLLAGGTPASASGKYNYITAEELEKRLNHGPSVILVDICPAEQFAEGHIRGSIETRAYPVKTDQEKARLDEAMSRITVSSDDVVIVCPGGGGGARSTVDYYKSKGVSGKRLLILEKGMAAWPYEKKTK